MLLINYTFGNYASFKDEQQFTMERTDKAKGTGSWRNKDISTVSAVYGANASGKSRFLQAIRFMTSFVSSSFVRGDDRARIDVPAFMLDKDSRNKPSTFLIDFIADDGLRYKYWFSVTKSEVLDEELYVYRSRRPSLLFSRSKDDDNHQDIVFGASFKGAKRPIWEITRSNSLFLSAAATAGNDMVAPVFHALTNDIAYYDAPHYDAELSSIKREAEEHDRAFSALQDLIQYADFGVMDLRLQERDYDESLTGMVAPLVDLLVDQVDPEKKAEARASFVKELKSEIAFQHKGNGVTEWFPMEAESDGTVAALSFLSVLLRALSTGSMALVDEIDKSLHPWLVREFVGLFTDPQTNPLQAQLLFTSHDESLIDEVGENRLLGRDQIWLTEKNGSGESELIPITEYSPRTRDNIGRNYSRGVYGAVPLLTLHEHVARAIDALIESGSTSTDASHLLLGLA